MGFDYDLVAIGGGSGGLAVVNRASEYGAKCLIVEHHKVFGGTCVHRGCVPKKIMWYGASVAHLLHDAKGYGFDVDVRGFDWAQLVRDRQAYIDNIIGFYDRTLGGNDNIAAVNGYATLLDNHTIDVDALSGGCANGAKHPWGRVRNHV